MIKTCNKDALVYSSDGSHLPKKKTKPTQPKTQSKHQVRVWKEKKGRKGKVVTVVSGLAFAAQDLKTLAGEFKKLCGSGGSVKNENIEIQGDHTQDILDALTDRGICAKRAGG